MLWSGQVPSAAPTAGTVNAAAGWVTRVTRCLCRSSGNGITRLEKSPTVNQSRIHKQREEGREGASPHPWGPCPQGTWPGQPPRAGPGPVRASAVSHAGPEVRGEPCPGQRGRRGGYLLGSPVRPARRSRLRPLRLHPAPAVGLAQTLCTARREAAPDRPAQAGRHGLTGTGPRSARHRRSGRGGSVRVWAGQEDSERRTDSRCCVEPACATVLSPAGTWVFRGKPACFRRDRGVTTRARALGLKPAKILPFGTSRTNL